MFDVRREDHSYVGRWAMPSNDHGRVTLYWYDPSHLGPARRETFDIQIFIQQRRSRCPNSIFYEEREAVIIPDLVWEHPDLGPAVRRYVLFDLNRYGSTDPLALSYQEWRRDLTRFDHGATSEEDELSTITAEEMARERI